MLAHRPSFAVRRQVHRRRARLTADVTAARMRPPQTVVVLIEAGQRCVSSRSSTATLAGLAPVSAGQNPAYLAVAS
jgi:hypothetical protein